MTDACPVPDRPSLNYHLINSAQCSDSLRHVLLDISRAGKYISYAIQTTEIGLAGAMNQFGENQQKLDVLSDEIVRDHLCESKLVNSYISEEQAEVVQLMKAAPYSVVFDPLDGSSLIDANFAIGSIFGVYETDTVIGKTPRDQVAAIYILYGPRTLFVYSTGKGVHTFILNDIGEFTLLQEDMHIDPEAKNYSPGNLRALESNTGYKKAFDLWVDEQKTLRYSGCMVADIHHIFSKGQGVFTNVPGEKYPEGKLRLPFECGPFAYLAEQAGGAASDGVTPILDIPIKNIDQRTPIIIGSKHEVERISKVLSE